MREIQRFQKQDLTDQSKPPPCGYDFSNTRFVWFFPICFFSDLCGLDSIFLLGKAKQLKLPFAF